MVEYVQSFSHSFTKDRKETKRVLTSSNLIKQLFVIRITFFENTGPDAQNLRYVVEIVVGNQLLLKIFSKPSP